VWAHTIGPMTTGSHIGLIGLPLFCLGLLGSLVAVGIRSWQRTAPLRRGLSPPPPVRATTRSSQTTRLAAWAGVGAAGWGLLLLLDGRSVGALVVLWGGAIVVSGVWSRVTSLVVDRAGIVVRYAARTPFAVDWANLRSLRPPRWPLGGWVLVGHGTRRTLMPSDVLGQERLLASIVGFAGFVFDGQNWVRC
jgi:hypothetical protein